VGDQERTMDGLYAQETLASGAVDHPGVKGIQTKQIPHLRSRARQRARKCQEDDNIPDP
jgi:hypothetical protein